MGLAVTLLLCQIANVVASCCDTVDVLGPSSIQSFQLGRFNKVAALSVGSRPVYKNSKGTYLYYWTDYQQWRVGSHYTCHCIHYICWDDAGLLPGRCGIFVAALDHFVGHCDRPDGGVPVRL